MALAWCLLTFLFWHLVAKGYIFCLRDTLLLLSDQSIPVFYVVHPAERLKQRITYKHILSKLSSLICRSQRFSDGITAVMDKSWTVGRFELYWGINNVAKLTRRNFCYCFILTHSMHINGRYFKFLVFIIHSILKVRRWIFWQDRGWKLFELVVLDLAVPWINRTAYIGVIVNLRDRMHRIGHYFYSIFN